jgi:hypothetical protein
LQSEKDRKQHCNNSHENCRYQELFGNHFVILAENVFRPEIFFMMMVIMVMLVVAMVVGLFVCDACSGSAHRFLINIDSGVCSDNNSVCERF